MSEPTSQARNAGGGRTMSQNPTNATYWKKQAEEARALAREAGAALARLEDTVADMIIEGMEISGEVDSARGYAVAILTKLDVAGLLPGKEGE